MSAYYAAIEKDLLVRGLMRRDGGGADTPYSAEDLARNFERIAFFDEYDRGGGLRAALAIPGRLKRWDRPVLIGLEFGPSTPDRLRTADTALVRAYTARIARLTRHPVSFAGPGDPVNFHVLVMSEDENDLLTARVRQIVPNINPSALGVFRNLPRSIHCLVVAFSSTPGGYGYDRAIALVRAEHPDLLRESCYHEEIAQGMGLANDSPAARPSIFNDDDEFALLTSHDEKMLAMLYDPRLQVGQSLDSARPTIRRISYELAPGPS